MQKFLADLLRSVCSFPAMLIVCLMAFVWVIASPSSRDPDIWWQLRYASDLVHTHQPATFDAYSFTVAGRSRINHEWAGPVPFYLGWAFSGLVGVQMVRMLLVEAIVLELLFLCYLTSGNIKSSVIACAFCSLLASVSFGPRVILLGYAYMVLLLILLEFFRRNKTRVLCILPVVFLVWVNTHGSWLLGFILFAIATVAGLIQGRWGRVEAVRWKPRELKTATAAALASAAALLVNPWGLRLVLFPFRFRSDLQLPINHVTEFSSINFHDVRGLLALILLILLLISFLVLKRVWRLAEVLMLLFALYLSLTYVRFLFVLAIVAAPVLAKAFDFIPQYDFRSDKRILNIIVMAAVVALVAKNYPIPSAIQLDREIATEYPARALLYLRTHPAAGRVLNAFEWGGYLTWFEPQLKVFIDGRTDLFEEAGVFADYLDLIAIRDPQRILDKYRIDYVLFPTNEPLIYILGHDPRWKLNYSDDVSVLFERVTPIKQ